MAALAETFDRPIAPHDGTGPVLLVANTQLFATENVLILETVRAHYRCYYRALATSLPRIEHGFAYSEGRSRPRHCAAPGGAPPNRRGHSTQLI